MLVPVQIVDEHGVPVIGSAYVSLNQILLVIPIQMSGKKECLKIILSNGNSIVVMDTPKIHEHIRTVNEAVLAKLAKP